MTREHIVSGSVLKVAFGDPIRNIARAEMFGSKFLVDHEAVVKDVCDKCNNVSLSPYDEAGRKLARYLEDNKGITPLKLPFSINTLGWLIKTHLNYTRVIKDVETQEAYPIKQSIKNSLIKGRAISPKQIALYVQQWEEEEQFWNAENPENVHYLQYRSIRLRDQEMVMSNFRIRQLNTMIFFPSNGNYKNFDSRVESAFQELKGEFNVSFQKIEIEKSLSAGKVDISSIFSIEEIMLIRYKIEDD
jgi:hypothetical protein